MEHKTALTYFEHEMIMSQMERKSKRLWVLALALFAAFLISNGFYILMALSLL